MSKSLNFVVNTRLDKRSSDLNGNHPIKLRVWNRASKQAKLYSCNKFTDEDSFNRAMDHKSTVKGDAFKLRLFLERVIANCNEVLEQNQVNTFSDFEKYMFNRTQDASDINFYINRKVEECHKNQQYSSKDIYKGLNKLLEAFSGGKSVQIDNLNKKWFEALESWYLNRKKKNGENYKVSSYSIYIRHFRVIINELVEEGIIELKNYPFGKKKYTIPSAENNKRPLESSDINKLIAYQSDFPLKQLAVDYWKLSYFWMGINLKDVITLKWSDIHDDKIYVLDHTFAYAYVAELSLTGQCIKRSGSISLPRYGSYQTRFSSIAVSDNYIYLGTGSCSFYCYSNNEGSGSITILKRSDFSFVKRI